MRRSDFLSDNFGQTASQESPSSRTTRIRFQIWLGLAAFGVVFAVFGHVLKGHGFVYDDDYLIVKNPYLGSWKNIVLFFIQDVTQMSGVHAPSGYYRPLSMALLQILFYFFGVTAWKYHLFNLVLHALNAFFTGLLIFKISKRKRLSFLSMLIFAIHPVHVEAFIMICSYMGAVSASMALLSVLLFVQSRIQQKSIWMFFSLGAYATSIFLKEDALVLPGVLFALDWIYFKKRKEDLFAKTILDLVPFFIFAVVYLGARYLFVTPGATFGFWNNIVQLNVHQPGGWVGWLGALFLVFKSYFILWIWPNPLTIYHVISLPEDIRGWVLFCCEWALLIIFGLKIIKNKLMAFGLAWFFIFSLLICNLIPIGGMFSERLIYLPSVGLAWITAVSLGELKKFLLKIIGGKILFTVILFVGAIGLSFQSYVYSQTWRSDFTIWEHARQVSPYRPYPYSHLAKTFYDQGDFRTAAHFFKRAAELTGVVSSTAVSRQRAAGAYGEAKEYDLAIREYKTLLAREPKLWDVYFALGWTYLMSGDDISAEKTFKDTLVKKPDHGWSYFGLAELAFKKGDDEKGRNLYTLALNHSSDEALMKTILKSLQGRSKQ